MTIKTTEELFGTETPRQERDKFYQNNPAVTGMADFETDTVSLNPNSKLSDTEKQAVIRNESFRLYAKQKNIVFDFDLTPEQNRLFANYSKNEQDKKATVMARIISGDPSAGNITPEQKQYAQNIGQKWQSSISEAEPNIKTTEELFGSGAGIAATVSSNPVLMAKVNQLGTLSRNDLRMAGHKGITSQKSRDAIAQSFAGSQVRDPYGFIQRAQEIGDAGGMTEYIGSKIDQLTAWDIRAAAKKVIRESEEKEPKYEGLLPETKGKAVHFLGVLPTEGEKARRYIDKWRREPQEGEPPLLMKMIAGGKDEANALMKANLFRKNPEAAKRMFPNDPTMMALADAPEQSFIPSLWNTKLDDERIEEVKELAGMTRQERETRNKAKGKIGIVEHFGERKDLREYMLFSGVLTALKSREYRESLERLQANQYAKDSPDKTRDQLIVRDKLFLLEEMQDKGITLPATILDAFTQMAKYAGEIYLMAGLIGGPAPPTQLGKIGLAAEMGAMNVGELATRIEERRADKGYIGDKGEFVKTEEGQPAWKALPKSFAEQTLTYWTEQQGEYIAKAMNKLGKGVVAKLPKGLASYIKKAGVIEKPFYDAIRKGKLDGMIPEIAEEYIERVIKPALLLDDQYRNKDDAYLTRVAKSFMPDPRELLIQTILFGTLPVAGMSYGQIRKGINLLQTPTPAQGGAPAQIQAPPAPLPAEPTPIVVEKPPIPPPVSEKPPVGVTAGGKVAGGATIAPEATLATRQKNFDTYRELIPNATEPEIVKAMIEDDLRPPTDVLERNEDMPEVKELREADRVKRIAAKARLEARERPPVAPSGEQALEAVEKAAGAEQIKEEYLKEFENLTEDQVGEKLQEINRESSKEIASRIGSDSPQDALDYWKKEHGIETSVELVGGIAPEGEGLTRTYWKDGKAIKHQIDISTVPADQQLAVLRHEVEHILDRQKYGKTNPSEKHLQNEVIDFNVEYARKHRKPSPPAEKQADVPQIEGVSYDNNREIGFSMAFDIEKGVPQIIVGTKGGSNKDITQVALHEKGHIETSAGGTFFPELSKQNPKLANELDAWQWVINNADRYDVQISKADIIKLSPIIDSKDIDLLDFQPLTKPPPPTERQAFRLSEEEVGKLKEEAKTLHSKLFKKDGTPKIHQNPEDLRRWNEIVVISEERDSYLRQQRTKVETIAQETAQENARKLLKSSGFEEGNKVVLEGIYAYPLTGEIVIDRSGKILIDRTVVKETDIPKLKRVGIVTPLAKQAEISGLETVADVEKLIAEKAKEYGGKNEYLASDEYKKLYPQVQVVYAKAKGDYLAKAKQAMDESGVKAGDKVSILAEGFGGMGEPVSGTVIMKAGVPYVKLDHEQMTSNGMRKQVLWHKGWRTTVAKQAEIPAKSKGVIEKPVKEKVMSAEEDARYAAAKELLKKKREVKGGFFKSEKGEQDVEAWNALLEVGRYHFKKGYREIKSWSAKVIEDMGNWVQPHLQKIWDEIAPKKGEAKPAKSKGLFAEPTKPTGGTVKSKSVLANEMSDFLKLEGKTLNLNYTEMHIADQVGKTIDFIANKPEEAVRIAYGGKNNTDIKTSAIKAGLFYQAKSEKNWDLAEKFADNSFTYATELGQQVVVLKGFIFDNSPLKIYSIMKSNLIDAASKKFGVGKEGSATQKVLERRNKMVSQVTEKMTTKQMKIKDALAFIESLRC